MNLYVHIYYVIYYMNIFIKKKFNSKINHTHNINNDNEVIVVDDIKYAQSQQSLIRSVSQSNSYVILL